MYHSLTILKIIQLFCSFSIFDGSVHDWSDNRQAILTSGLRKGRHSWQSLSFMCKEF